MQAIAQVYGLQVGAGGPLHVASVLEAIALSVQRTFGRAIAGAASTATSQRVAAARGRIDPDRADASTNC